MKVFIFLGNLLILLFFFTPNAKHYSKTACETFYETALDKMVTDQNIFIESYLIGDEDDYKRDYDFKNNTLLISKKNNGKKVVQIKFIHVGYFDSQKSSWHWAWENGSLDQRYETIKKYGLEKGCSKLSTGQWSGKELNAWEMAAAVNHILSGKGAARHYTPSEYNYVVFLEIKSL